MSERTDVFDPAKRSAVMHRVRAKGTTPELKVRRALTDEISERCPATVLRRHPAATIFLDGDSAGKLS